MDEKVKFSRPVPPFVRYCAATIPTVFDDSLSYYECLCALWKWLQDNLVNTVNDNAAILAALKDYVENYLNSEEIQNAINNKLDEMAEDGTLRALLNMPATTEYLGTIKVGSDLEMDENDRLNVVKHINYIDDIVMHTTVCNDEENDVQSDIWYSIIPNQYKPHIVCSDENDPHARAEAFQFDYKYKPTLMVNAGGWSQGVTYGPLIIDGDMLIGNNEIRVDHQILTIADNGTLGDLPGTITDTELEQLGITNCVRGWHTLYKNGVDYTSALSTEKHPRTIIAQNDTHYFIMVAGGRKAHDTGMNFASVVKFINTTMGFHANIIYELDGGQSSNFLYHGIRQNAIVSQDRKCANWLVWTSDSAETESGVFKAQSSANEAIINNSLSIFGDYINLNEYKDDTLTNVTLYGATGRILNDTLVNISCRISVTDTNLEQYTTLFTGLPKAANNIYFYFPIQKLDTTFGASEQRILVIQNSDDGKTSTIKTRFQLPVGEYYMNFTYSCARQ